MIKRTLFACTLLLVLSPFVLASWPSEVTEIVALNRTRFALAQVEEEVIQRVESLLYPYRTFADAPELIPLDKQQGYAKSFLTKKEALADTEFLFQLLKHGYAGYQYRGGDERFLAAKEAIITRLEKDFPTRFNTGDFQNLLYQELKFINDGHFYIGNQHFMQAQKAYIDFTHCFFRDEKGFYLIQQEEKVYATEINGENPANYLLPSLNEAGEVVYRVGVIKEVGLGPQVADLKLKAGMEEAQLALPLVQMEKSPIQMDYHAIYQQSELAGIPVITVNRFPTSGPEIELFAEDAKRLKERESLIIDLRHNYGGSTEYVVNWLVNFTDGTPDSFVSPGLAKVSLLTPTSIQLTIDFWERLANPAMVEYIKSMAFSETGWSNVGYVPPRQASNPVKVVVLTDSTGSAGEFFVNFLLNVENVVVIGTNTEGLLQFGFPYRHPLPNSWLNVTLAADFMPQPDLVDREGMGYLPDFWVDPEEALDLAVKFIKNYGWNN